MTEINNPKVSVIMNCYNSGKYLKEAIDSVYAQTYKDWEIIFWDNLSTDESPNIAKSYDDKLRYFRGKTHLSLGAARNCALKKCKGRYISFLDCDDKWLELKLEKQVEILEKNSDIGLVYSNFYEYDEINQKQSCVFKKKAPSGDIFQIYLRTYLIGILTVMIRTEILDNLDQYFDQKLNLAEDFDFFLRFLYYAKADYIHDPLAIRRVHQNMLTINNLLKFSDENLYVLDKVSKIVNSENVQRVIYKRKKEVFVAKAERVSKMQNYKEFLRIINKTQSFSLWEKGLYSGFYFLKRFKRAFFKKGLFQT